MQDSFELAVLMNRILCDSLPPRLPAEICYLFGTSQAVQGSSVETGIDLLNKKIVTKIGVLKERDPNHDYLCFDDVRNRFLKRELSVANVVPVSGDRRNTLEEATTFVRSARDHGFKTVIATTHPPHQFRAFLTMVSVALQNYPELKIYSVPGQALSWYSPLRHSAATGDCSPFELMPGELRRIAQYQRAERPSIAPFSEIFDYLRRRDS